MDAARPTSRAARRWLAAALAALPAAAALSFAGSSPAQDLHTRLERKQSRLQEVRQHAGVLSTTIHRYSSQIAALSGQVAALRNREAAVQADLDRAQAELAQDKARLRVLQRRLRASLAELRRRLVSLYRTSQPSVLTVILESRGFNDMISRVQYLRAIDEHDNAIVARVRRLRDEQRDTVRRMRALRNRLAARRAELARTRQALESREQELAQARASKRQALARVQASQVELEGDVSKIQDQIQAQIQAAQAAEPAPVAGPVQGGSYTPGPESSSGFIWPVNGPVVSGFGPRTINGGYEFHPGIDIAVPTGTPIHAAAAGTVILEESEASSGGYGNYTCIDHGGGLSTCYAHQESFAVSQGQHVSQGQVIGYSDCTGYCFGPHLHFEVRVNGQVVDPMGYLP